MTQNDEIEQRHAECTDFTYDYGDWTVARHECRPCPHGFRRGGEFRLNGNPQVDQHQRLLRLQALEVLRCEVAHPGAPIHDVRRDPPRKPLQYHVHLSDDRGIFCGGGADQLRDAIELRDAWKEDGATGLVVASLVNPEDCPRRRQGSVVLVGRVEA